MTSDYLTASKIRHLADLCNLAQIKFPNMRSGWIGLGIAAVALGLMSAGDGVAESQNKDRTGAPGSSATCGSCHSGGNFGTSLSISLLDPLEGLQTFEDYTPGLTYRLRVQMNYTQSTPARFGMQATAVTGDGNNAGTFSQPSGNTQLESVGGRHIFEHNAPSSDAVFEVLWTAPAAGSGPVTVYASGIAANGNGGTGGDQYGGGSATFGEAAVNHVGQTTTDAAWRIVPRGSGWWLTGPEGSVAIYDLQGREVAGHPLFLGEWLLDASQLPQGVLIAQFRDAEGRVATMKRWFNP